MNRTKPVGVRFDPEKLEFVKGREKLTTNQQVVDFLINQYWWSWKVAKPTHQEVPPIQFKTPTAESYDGAKFPANFTHDEPLSFDRLKEEVENKPSYMQLLNGMAKVLFPDEKEDYAKKIYAADHLTEKQREALINQLKNQQ